MISLARIIKTKKAREWDGESEKLQRPRRGFPEEIRLSRVRGRSVRWGNDCRHFSYGPPGSVFVFSPPRSCLGYPGGCPLTVLLAITQRLCERTLALSFALPVTHVYQPLDYAWQPHSRYLERYGHPPIEALLLGMNPGPFGMAQTGIPFGDIELVSEWLGIREPVKHPDNEHPKRPVLGFDCTRREVSGRRLWSWARGRFGEPEHFFRRFFVWNYCPLSFMEASGRNRTPDKLPVSERRALFEVCDEALVATVQHLCPRYVVGVGRFAAARATAVLDPADVTVGVAPHPSPANPAANRGWEPIFEKALREIGIAPLP